MAANTATEPLCRRPGLDLTQLVVFVGTPDGAPGVTASPSPTP